MATGRISTKPERTKFHGQVYFFSGTTARLTPDPSELFPLERRRRTNPFDPVQWKYRQDRSARSLPFFNAEGRDVMTSK